MRTILVQNIKEAMAVLAAYPNKVYVEDFVGEKVVLFFLEWKDSTLTKTPHKRTFMDSFEEYNKKYKKI